MGRNKGIYILGEGSYSDYLNFVYDQTTQDEVLIFMKEIRNELKVGDLFPFHFNDVREDTTLYTLLSREHKDMQEQSKAVGVVVPESQEEYTAKLSKNTRSNLKASVNRMKKNEIDYRIEYLTGVQTEEFAKQLNQIHADRFDAKNSTEGLTFVHKVSKQLMNHYLKWAENRYNIVLNSMQRNENSFFGVVYLNDDIGGYFYGLRDKSAVRFMHICFKDEYKYYSPLFLAMYRTILKEIEEKV